ncbi:hypothetical protein PS043_09930 [Escherichia albertii]|nr:hypothetical protein [Escherichia albertii]WDC31615.1 hypothetical protein PS043_09930 [Escherichia albertii]
MVHSGLRQFLALWFAALSGQALLPLQAFTIMSLSLSGAINLS